MRINKFIALATGLSRRSADTAIVRGRVKVNGAIATLGGVVESNVKIYLDDKPLILPEQTTTIVFNKPVGYVCSRNGQGSKTIYDILPEEFKSLKPIGRLDKDSSGLLLLTNDGTLSQHLTHPKFKKLKVYDIKLNKSLTSESKLKIEHGVQLEDGLSKLQLEKPNDQHESWRVIMYEGRNRQIRRTFATLGYEVQKLHRIQFGDYKLAQLIPGHTQRV